MAGTVAVATDKLVILERLSTRTKLIGISELAEMLDESHSTIYRRARRGEMPSFRWRNTVKFDPREIAAWLRDHHIAREE